MSFGMFHGAGRFSERLSRANEIRIRARILVMSTEKTLANRPKYMRRLQSLRRADRIYSEIYCQESRRA